MSTILAAEHAKRDRYIQKSIDARAAIEALKTLKANTQAKPARAQLDRQITKCERIVARCNDKLNQIEETISMLEAAFQPKNK